MHWRMEARFCTGLNGVVRGSNALEREGGGAGDVLTGQSDSERRKGTLVSFLVCHIQHEALSDTMCRQTLEQCKYV